MLCLFNFPAYMDCNVGYRIPSSQATASHSLSTVEADTDIGCIRIQWGEVSSCYSLLNRPDRNHHRRLHRNVFH